MHSSLPLARSRALPFALLAGLAAVSVSPSASAQTSELLRDIHRGFASDPGSFPQDYTRLGALAFFSADAPATGREPYVTDGTVAGTFLLRDTWPGTQRGQVTGFAVLGQQAYFFADDGVHGRELWASDGSKFGTRMVHELKPGWDSWYPSYLTAGGGKLFFLARETANSSTELYSFDPATRSTLRLSNVPANGLTFIHGRLKGTAKGLFFFADTANQVMRPWFSDGTPAGTIPVPGIAPGSSAFYLPALSFVEAGKHVVFAASTTGGPWDQQLYATDASGQNVVVLDGAAPANDPKYYEELFFDGTRLWIAADQGSNSRVSKLYSSLLQPGDIRPVVDAQSRALQGRNFFRARNRTWFFAHEDGKGIEPWSSDGTAAGTRLELELAPGSADLWGSVGIEAGGSLFFAHQAAGGRGLLVSDGTTAGTRSLRPDTNFEIMGYDPFRRVLRLTALAGRVVFFGGDATLSEPWVSDGTVPGTQMLANISPPFGAADSAPRMGFTLGGRILFRATDEVHGAGLWSSDGTRNGTQFVADLDPNSEFGELVEAVEHNGLLWMRVTIDRFDFQLWVSDGTSAGTRRLQFGGTGPDLSVTRLLGGIGDELYFLGSSLAAHGELWASDGTVAGTRIVRDFVPGQRAAQVERAGWNGNAIYMVISDPAPKSSLWVFDAASPSGREIPLPTQKINAARTDIAFVGSQAYFPSVDTNGGSSAMTSDGTVAGTRSLLQSTTDTFTAAFAGETKVFWLRSTPSSTEIWCHDTLTQQTHKAASFELIQIVHGCWQDRLVFEGYVQRKATLQITDGTAAGTTQLGTPGISAPPVAAFGSRHFAISLLNYSSEILVSDGSPAGTRALPVGGAPGVFAITFGTLRGDVLVGAWGPDGLEPYKVSFGAGQHDMGRPCGPDSPGFWMDDPVLGQQAKLRGRHAPVGSVAALLLGPFDPRPLPLPGTTCTLYVDAARLVLFDPFVYGGDSWSRSLSVPSDPSLSGLSFAMQVLYVGTGAAQLQMSPGIGARMGL
jgi:ELWxxDGT repeat protein